MHSNSMLQFKTDVKRVKTQMSGRRSSEKVGRWPLVEGGLGRVLNPSQVLGVSGCYPGNFLKI